MIKIAFLTAAVILYLSPPLFAQQRFLHGISGTSAMQAAMWMSKDLGLFEKYGLQVDLVFIPNGVRAMQALLGGSAQSVDASGITAVNAILQGGDAVIVAGLSNKPLFKFVARSDIRDPKELKGKKIGLAGFGGSNEFVVVLALNKWGISRDAVTLVAAGDSGVRLVALQRNALDATVLPYDQAKVAEAQGIRILADVPELIPSFPDSVISIRRAFLEKERGTLKRFIQAISEGIYEFQTSRDKGMSMLARRLKLTDRKTVEQNYNMYRGVFPLPPRVGKEGLRAVLEQIQVKSGVPKPEPDLALLLNESVTDELEKEGFYRNLAQR
jgi:NitT/TauT family transport system substrate-binding protein